MLKKFLLMVLVLAVNTCSAQNDSIFIASWNVENLFDTIDNPNTNDEEFTPSGSKEWTLERYNRKIENLSKVLSEMNSNTGPDILGLVEVENKSVVEDLAAKASFKAYSVVHFESPDFRGIDNALLYDNKKFDFISANTYKVILDSNKTTRDILRVSLKNKNDGEIFNFFVNHWPSRRGGLADSEANRISAAEVLKSAVDSLYSVNENSNIIIMGDFNDETDNRSISEILQSKNFKCDDDQSDKYLLNTSAQRDELGEGTYLYQKNWNMLDQIIISKSLDDNKGWEYKCDSFDIFKKDYMITKEGYFKGAIIPSYGGRKYLDGYSDHYPVTITLIK